MRSRASVTHATSAPQTPPVEAASTTTKSKKQPTTAAQPSGPTATDNEEKA